MDLMFLGVLYTMLFEHFQTCFNLSEAVDLVELKMQVPCAVLVFSHFALKLIICTYVPFVAFRCRLAATGYRRVGGDRETSAGISLDALFWRLNFRDVFERPLVAKRPPIRGPI